MQIALTWSSLSALTGYVKPDRQIFELTASRLGVELNEMVFIDDRQSNVNPARSYGIESILFHDTEQLMEELKKLVKNITA